MHPLRDLRLAVRSLWRHPTFAAATVVALALGVGANTAVFSILHGVLLHPLPYAHADRLALLTGTSKVSVPDAVDWRARSRTLPMVAVLLRQWDVDLVGQGDPERLTGSIVDPHLFQVLGVKPILGRALVDDDDRPGATRVATISERLWRRQFGADPTVIGRAVVLNEHATTIVGVMPLTADVFGDQVQVWLPVATETPWALTQRGTNNFNAIGRLRPGATWDEARRELSAISADLTRVYPATNTGKLAAPEPLLGALVGDVRTPIVVLESAVFIVLMLVMANIVGLLIARGCARRNEVAVRTALGARRSELAMLLAAEGVVIASVGGTLGIALAAFGQRLLVAALPSSLPRAADIHVSAPVVAFTVALILFSGFVLAAVPASYAARVTRGRGPGLAKRGQDAPGQRLLSGLVAVEVGLAVVVLSLSALLGRTFIALEAVHLGFDPTHVVVGEFVLPESRYSQIGPQTRAFRAVVRRMAASPGVEAAGSVIGLPFGPGGGIGHTIAVEGQAVAIPGSEPSVRVRPVVGEYFRALRIPIVGGRAFTESDDERAMPVAIVNEALARRLWPGGSPLGHRIKWIGADGDPPWMTIIGVAGDTRSNDLATGDPPAAYVPYVQRTEAWQRWGTLVVRGAGDPAALVATLRAAVGAVDPLVPLGPAAALTEYRSAAVAQQRLDAVVLAVFALGALLIAVQGIYGTLAYVVEQRRHEISIRVAVGATPRAVRRAVVARGMRATAIGIGAGVLAAAAAGHVVGDVLYGVSPTDPVTYLAVAAIIAAAAWCGALVPAVRASRADPLSALRGT